MAKSNSYMDRAMRSADPRFAHVLGKLGYQRSDLVARAEKEEDELGELRDRNTVEVLVGRLRRKVGAQRITTQRGLGYRFEN